MYRINKAFNCWLLNPVQLGRQLDDTGCGRRRDGWMQSDTAPWERCSTVDQRKADIRYERTPADWVRFSALVLQRLLTYKGSPSRTSFTSAMQGYCRAEKTADSDKMRPYSFPKWLTGKLHTTGRNSSERTGLDMNEIAFWGSYIKITLKKGPNNLRRYIHDITTKRRRSRTSFRSSVLSIKLYHWGGSLTGPAFVLWHWNWNHFY